MEQCGNANNFFYKDGKKIFRQKCTIWTRVMGYLRNHESFNIGKKSEFFSRKYFVVDNTKVNKFQRFNREFIEKYSK